MTLRDETLRKSKQRIACLLPLATGACLLLESGMLSAQTREEAASACRAAADMIDDNESVDEALAEAQWCVEVLEQLQDQLLASIFPEELLGYTRSDGDSNSGGNFFGAAMIASQYENSDGDVIDVSLMSGTAGDGLAAIANIGMQLGMGQGKRQRINRRIVTDLSEMQGGDAQLLVELQSGGMLNFSSSTVPAEDVLEFIRAFPIVEIDETLK